MKAEEEKQRESIRNSKSCKEKSSSRRNGKNVERGGIRREEYERGIPEHCNKTTSIKIYEQKEGSTQIITAADDYYRI